MYTPLEMIAAKYQQAHAVIETGSVYAHYRNPQLHYKVLNVAILEATEEPCVVYQSMYEPALVWVRPISSWLALVDHDGKMVFRFQKIN